MFHHLFGKVKFVFFTLDYFQGAVVRFIQITSSSDWQSGLAIPASLDIAAAFVPSCRDVCVVRRRVSSLLNTFS